MRLCIKELFSAEHRLDCEEQCTVRSSEGKLRRLRCLWPQQSGSVSGSLRAGHCHCFRACIRIMAAHGRAMSTNVSRGAFILFEGGDRCGKTTQSDNLVNHLSSKGVRPHIRS